MLSLASMPTTVALVREGLYELELVELEEELLLG
jgi:hypothetical protein